MPFCTQCGTQVYEQDVFCGSCGSRQAAAADPAAAAPGKPFLGDVKPSTVSMLCYVPWMGWVAAIIVLASSRFRDDPDTRFHAFQGLYLAVAWMIADRVLKPMMRHWDVPFVPFLNLVGMLKLLLLAASILMIVKALQMERFRLPFFGDLADKSVAEQR